MRFLANENFPGNAVTALRAAGSDVVWIGTEAPGSSDQAVLAWAARDERVLITFDKDFGELAKASGLPARCGVILLRVPMPRPDKVGERLAISSWRGMIGRGIFRWSNRGVSECGHSYSGRSRIATATCGAATATDQDTPAPSLRSRP